jgi:glutathione peroxidase
MPVLRRDCLILLGALAATGARATEGAGANARDFSFANPDGSLLALAGLSGRSILVVNTATSCGYAGQFVGLQGLWTRFGERGLTVIAVPSPDFGNQEPLDGAAIAESARKNYGATFPVVDKTHVRGAAAHPFYRWAAAEKPAQTPQWNFHKYLVGRDGSLRAAFGSPIEPNDPRIISAIVAELGTT